MNQGLKGFIRNLLIKLAALHKFRIPTLFGLGLITVSIGLGVYLVAQKQNLFVQASLNQTPQNVTISNIEDSKVTISWQTPNPVSTIITYGINSDGEQTALDDRDGSEKPRTNHYVTLEKLTPQTNYQYKIISGKSSLTSKFTTAKVATTQNGFIPIIGTVSEDNQPLQDGIVYLNIDNAVTQSALIKNSGNFIIPLSLIRDAALDSIYVPQEDTTGKLTIFSDKGSATVVTKLSNNQPLGPIKIGDNLDLTQTQITATPTPTPQTNPDLIKFDLSNDSLISTADYAIILKNFGNSPQEKRADINGDGVVNQKDLAEMSKKINDQNR